MPTFSPVSNVTNSTTFFAPSVNGSLFFDYNESNLTALSILSMGTLPFSFLPMENWDRAETKEKADYLAVELFTQLTNSSSCEQAAIREEFKQQQHYFFAELDKDTCDKWILAWQILKEKKARDITRFGLINLALEAYIDTYPQADISTAYNYGVSLYEDDTPLTFVPVLEKLRLYKLKDNLCWINLKHMEKYKEDPLSLFKFILSHNNHPYPKHDFWKAISTKLGNQFPEESLRSFDETVLVWNQLQTGEMLKGVTTEDNGVFVVSTLRNAFKKAFLPSFQKQEIIDQLFRQTEQNTTEIYFDGFVLRNAQNYLFNELIDRPELRKVAGYERLTSEQKQAYLQEAFQQMGESTQYAIGSLSHSLASCLIRVFHYQYHRMPPLFSHEQQLITLFKQAEEEWVEKKNYPVNLRILAAIHLAHSNNIAIEGNDWQKKLEFALNYFASEFQYILEPERIEQLTPYFDERKAAWQVLKTYGMTDEEIYAKRPPYKMIVPNSEKEAQDGVLTRIEEVPLRSDNALDEFLKKARINKITNWMVVRLHLIDPRALLEEKRKEHDNQLIREPWIEEKARANLQSQAITITPEHLEEEKQHVLEVYKNAVQNPQKWAKSTHDWVYFIPVIGPLETIYEGLKKKDLATVLLGVVFLSLDGWSLGLGSLLRSAPLALTRLSARELVTANSLKTSLKLFDVSAADVVRAEPIVNREPFAFEESYEALANSVRQGARGELWRDKQGEEHLLAYLEDEDRIVAVKNQGGYYREIDWKTGKVNLKKSLIYKDKDTGRYAVSSLKGGAPDRYHFFMELIPDIELKGRPTVKEALTALNKADDYTHYEDFLEKFRRQFSIFKAEGEVFDIEALSEQVYKNSPTFRRLFNKFVASADPLASPWRIEAKTGQDCHTDLLNKVVYLDPNVEKSAARYLSTITDSENFAGEIFKLERTVIHELIHALTNMDDLASLAKGKLSSKANRGGVVFLTDRILFEAFESVPERLVYQAYSKEQVVINRETLISRLVQENHYLDNEINAAIPIEEYKMIKGEPLSLRYTVQEMGKVFDVFASRRTRNFFDFSERFLELFTGQDEVLLDELSSFFSAVYEESKIFQRLFERYSVQQDLSDVVEFIEVKRNSAAIVIPPREGAIHLVEDDMWYLSSMGPLPIERRRRFLEGVVEVMADLKAEVVPEEMRFSHRGILVQIVDRIFRDANMESYFPKRLTAAGFLPSESFTQLLPSWSDLSRVADLEDRLIEKEIYAKAPRCSWFSCFPPLRKNRRENIKETMEEIKQNNQQWGITHERSLSNVANGSNDEDQPSLFADSSSRPGF